MRVLVCGGRTFKPGPGDYALLAGYLMPGSVLIHGAAPGADTFAAEFAQGLGFVEIHAFPARWKELGKIAGPMRNTQMLKEGKPDIVLAFPGGRGTSNMIAQAKASGIQVVVSQES